MKKEKCCGILVFKEEEGKLSMLLVHHNIGHWGIPKGHVEPDETEMETATREVFEETGVKATILPGFREVITYSPKEGVLKDVVFFLGTLDSDSCQPQGTEVSEARFVEKETAFSLVTHLDEQGVLERGEQYYREHFLRS